MTNHMTNIKNLTLLSLSLFTCGNVFAQDQVEVKPLPVTVTVTGPDETTEGLDSGLFSVAVEPADAVVTSYDWFFGTPVDEDGNGPGNDPSVDFSTPSQKTTIVKKARWFAFPDKPWRRLTGITCTYSIICEVTVNGKTYNNANARGLGFPWRVTVLTTEPKTLPPSITGTPTTGVRKVGGKDQWFVTGIGTLARVPAKKTPGKLPESSQFYNKIMNVHEKRHEEQFNNGAGGLELDKLWNVNDLYNNYLKDLTADEEDTLTFFINQQIKLRDDIDRITVKFKIPAMEDDANAISNLATPPYLNQTIPFDQTPAP